MSDQEYKNTYPVDVEYMDGTKETIQFPRISSEVFFDVMSEINLGTGILEIKLFNMVVKQMAPGLLAKITIKSALNLAKKFGEMEKETLGEVLEPVPETTDGKSESQDELDASSSTTSS